MPMSTTLGPTSPSHAEGQRRSHVLHFVTGGFSGATAVAIDLVKAAAADPGLNVQATLVLRRKRKTPWQRVEQLHQTGLRVHMISGWSHWFTILQLFWLCRKIKPDVLVAHGFPEHIIGRYAGWLAGIKTLIHVEHNSRERYTWLRLAQARWLAKRTRHLVGVSESVCDNLRYLGFPAEKITSIPNGVDVSRFYAVGGKPLGARKTQAVMCGRFAGQKDHATLIQAAALLKSRGIICPILLAGGGARRHRQKAERLCASLGLTHEVQFLGVCDDIPLLLGQSRVAVLSTHYEGMPLALIEAMAAGCVVIGSDVPGVKDIIRDHQTGLLVPHEDAHALADAIISAVNGGESISLYVENARIAAMRDYSTALSARRHYALYAQP